MAHEDPKGIVIRLPDGKLGLKVLDGEKTQPTIEVEEKPKAKVVSNIFKSKKTEE